MFWPFEKRGVTLFSGNFQLFLYICFLFYMQNLVPQKIMGLVWVIYHIKALPVVIWYKLNFFQKNFSVLRKPGLKFLIFRLFSSEKSEREKRARTHIYAVVKPFTKFWFFLFSQFCWSKTSFRRILTPFWQSKTFQKHFQKHYFYCFIIFHFPVSFYNDCCSIYLFH